MKSRPFFIALGAIAAVLLSGAAAVAIAIATNNPLTVLRGLPDTSPAAAALVPKDAPAMVSLLVNPDRVEALRQVLTPPGLQRQARQEWHQWRDGLLERSGLSYDRDVRPWLGREVTWALTALDLDRDGSNGDQPGYLLVAESSDAERSREFLELFWQRQALNGIELIFERYKGVSIASAQPTRGLPQLGRSGPEQSEPTGLATALVGDRFVLLASSPLVLRDAINNVQAPGLSLAADVGYQRAMDRLPGNRAIVGVVQPPTAGRWLLGDRAAAGAANDAPWQPFDRAIAAVHLTRAGVAADLVLEGDPAALPAMASTNEGIPPLLQAVPANALLAAAGPDLRQLWNQADQALDGTRTGDILDRAIAAIQERIGLNWDDDVLAWNQEPYALALLPADPGDRPEERALGDFPGDWTFAVERDDTTAAALDRLDQLARDRGTSVSILPLGDRQITVWSQIILPPRPTLFRINETTRIVTRVEGVRTTVDNLELFASSVPALRQAIAAAERGENGPTLMDRPAIAAIADPSPRPNDGLFYLDWPRARRPLARTIPGLQFLDTALNSVSNRVESITFSSYGGDDGTRQATLTLRLSRL